MAAGRGRGWMQHGRRDLRAEALSAPPVVAAPCRRRRLAGGVLTRCVPVPDAGGNDIDCSEFRFDATAWANGTDGHEWVRASEREEPTVRQRLADGLVECGTLVGKREAQLTDMLGGPDDYVAQVVAKRQRAGRPASSATTSTSTTSTSSSASTPMAKPPAPNSSPTRPDRSASTHLRRPAPTTLGHSCAAPSLSPTQARTRKGSPSSRGLMANAWPRPVAAFERAREVIWPVEQGVRGRW